MATNHGDGKEELSTWQEIGQYLGVSYRTAQVWHKERGLPVRKIGGRVSAGVAELDAWKLAQGRPTAPPDGDEPAAPVATSAGGRPVRPRVWFFVLVASAAVIAACGVWWLAANGRAEQPDAFGIAGRVLTVSGASGGTLWQYRFPRPFIANANHEIPACILVDLDGDGSLETLCRYDPVARTTEGERLYCFDSRGRVRWIFEPGGTVLTAGREYRRPYYVARFLVLPPDSSHHSRIVVSSNHNWSHPTQVAVLDYRGRVLSEYWHHGHLLHAGLIDADGDGK